MSDGGAQVALSWNSGASQWQAISNARKIPARFVDAKAPIRVIATLHWALDGTEQLHTEATAWTTGPDPIVLVTIRDPRWQLLGVWLPAADITRASTEPSRQGDERG